MAFKQASYVKGASRQLFLQSAPGTSPVAVGISRRRSWMMGSLGRPGASPLTSWSRSGECGKVAVKIVHSSCANKSSKVNQISTIKAVFWIRILFRLVVVLLKGGSRGRDNATEQWRGIPGGARYLNPPDTDACSRSQASHLAHLVHLMIQNSRLVKTRNNDPDIQS